MFIEQEDFNVVPREPEYDQDWIEKEDDNIWYQTWGKEDPRWTPQSEDRKKRTTWLRGETWDGLDRSPNRLTPEPLDFDWRFQERVFAMKPWLTQKDVEIQAKSEISLSADDSNTLEWLVNDLIEHMKPLSLDKQFHNRNGENIGTLYKLYRYSEAPIVSWVTADCPKSTFQLLETDPYLGLKNPSRLHKCLRKGISFFLDPNEVRVSWAVASRERLDKYFKFLSTYSKAVEEYCQRNESTLNEIKLTNPLEGDKILLRYISLYNKDKVQEINCFRALVLSVKDNIDFRELTCDLIDIGSVVRVTIDKAKTNKTIPIVQALNASIPIVDQNLGPISRDLVAHEMFADIWDHYQSGVLVDMISPSFESSWIDDEIDVLEPNKSLWHQFGFSFPHYAYAKKLMDISGLSSTSGVMVMYYNTKLAKEQTDAMSPVIDYENGADIENVGFDQIKILPSQTVKQIITRNKIQVTIDLQRQTEILMKKTVAQTPCSDRASDKFTESSDDGFEEEEVICNGLSSCGSYKCIEHNENGNSRRWKNQY